MLPAFRHLRLVALGQRTTTQGLRYAVPEMMALSNLLAHRDIGNRRVTELIAGRKPLRSAKDLGRVLALARLATREEVEQWPEVWAKALHEKYGESDAAELGAHAGDGLRELLTNVDAFAEAHFTADLGLLRGHSVSIDQLRAVAEQVIVDAVEPLAALTAQPAR